MGDDRMIFAVFADDENAEDAVSDLEIAGYDPKDMSLVMRDKEMGERMAGNTGTHVTDGVVTGATTGGIIGGLAGLLIGIGAIAVPGIGGLLIGGPLAAALGLTGAAATTISGAATGVLAGGLLGALMGLGIPEEDATYYENRVKEGGILLAVPTRRGREEEVREILEEYGADQVRAFNFDRSFKGGRRHLDRSV